MAVIALGLAPFGCFFTVADLEEGSGNGGGGAGGGGNGGAGGGAVTSGSGGGAEACEAGEPCVASPPGATFMLRVAGSGQYPQGSEQFKYTWCDGGCFCDQTGSGTCFVDAYVYQGSACSIGTPYQLSPGPCDSSFSLGQVSDDTSSASATVTVVGRSTCEPTPTQVDSSEAFGCQIEPTDTCGPGKVCLPPGAGGHCLILPDGATCPPSYLTKRMVARDTQPVDCKCRCDQCADLTVTVYEEKSCAGPSVTFQPDAIGSCVATPFRSLSSGYVPPSAQALCTAFGKPSGPGIETLCCPD